MTDQIPLANLTEAAIEISRQAGEAILKVYRDTAEFQIEHKEDKTPVTNADYAAHDIIVAALEQLQPSLPILSEESTRISFKERSQWQTYWLVDPLDGTREFIRRSDEFSVNIALVHQHEAILGVIYAPVTRRVYYAYQGSGAWRRDAYGEPFRITTRTLNQDLPLTIAGSRSLGNPRQQRYLQNLDDYELIAMGSSLKSCLVAEGSADLYPRLGPTSEWDTAAAQCIVEEAGGHLTTTDLQPLRYNTKASLLNPHFFVFGDNSRDWSQYL